MLQQVVNAVLHLTSALEFLELYAVGGKPLTIRMVGGKALLDLSVVVDLAFLSVDEQDLARLQTTLLGYLCRVEVHHAHF